MVVDFKWTLHEEGLIADRPTAGTDCRIYYATDEDILYYDDGSSWTAFDWAAGHVLVSILTGATYDNVQDFMNFFGNRTLFSGGTISDGGSGTADIAACTAWCKESDSDTAIGRFFNYAGKTGQALTNNSVNAIYLDYNGGTPQIVVATDYTTYGFQQDHVLIGAVYRQDNTLHIFQSDFLGIGGDNIGFMHAVEHHGAHRSSGMITTDGGSLALAVSTGVLYAGHNRHTTTADGSTWSYWYTEDSGSTWEEVTSQSVLTQHYNDIDASPGKVALTSNRYGVHWVYMDIDGVHIHIVYGQGDYTANEAEEALVPSVLPPIVVGYCVLIAKIINQEGETDMTITYPWTTVFTSSLATDHNLLANLTVGDVHTQYTLKSLFDAANTILKADVQATPEGLTVAEQRLVGRITDGVITALTGAQVMALLSGQAGAEFLFNTQKIGGVVDPTANQQAATKKYVDDSVAEAGGGDMLKAVYDTDENGVVDNSEKLEGSSKAQVQDHNPKAHKTSHQNGGADKISVAGLSGLLADDQHVLDAEVKLIKLDDLATPDDNADLNASTSRHGLLKKLSNSASQFMNGVGNWIAIQAASLTASGISELATAAEINIGDDTVRTISPKELSDSNYGKRIMYIKVLANDTALATGDGKAYITIPIELNGMNLVLAHACVYTKSSSGLPAISLERSVDQGSNWTDMLSTDITIDVNEFSSYTANTAPVIDGAQDDVATGYWIRVNVDTAGTGTKGLDVILTFQLP